MNSANLKCHRCHCEKSILHRTSPYGEIPANFTCYQCLTPQEKLSLAPDIVDITNLINKSNE